MSARRDVGPERGRLRKDYRRFMPEATRNARPDLILTAAQDYDWGVLRPFAESLGTTGYDGEIVTFATSLTSRAVDELSTRNVQLIRPRRARRRWGSHVLSPYTPRTTRLRWHGQPHLTRVVQLLVSSARNRQDAAAALVGFLGNVEVARYGWYYRYLARHGHRYRNVMLTDIRDVIFLDDPFSFEIGEAVWFFLEDDGFRLRDQTNNRGWLIGAYGETAFEAIGDCPIACSGLTIGSTGAMLGYLELMVNHLARLPRQFRGIDQGVHNYLLHNDLVPKARAARNSESPVLTVGMMSGDDALGLLRSRSSTLKAVHQYDRHPVVAAELAAILETKSSS